MSKLIAPLTDTQLRNAKPAEKSCKLSDGGGLHVEVMPGGSKFWRMKVRQANGKEIWLTFRCHPEVTLAAARAERSKAKQRSAGVDPAQHKRQALLRELHKLTGHGVYLFPRRTDHEKPASNGAILIALRRMGYRGRNTGHGFRSLAMGVIKARLGYRHEGVIRQLAHGSDDDYGEAYDREQFQKERRVMMQAYADYIDRVESVITSTRSVSSVNKPTANGHETVLRRVYFFDCETLGFKAAKSSPRHRDCWKSNFNN